MTTATPDDESHYHIQNLIRINNKSFVDVKGFIFGNVTDVAVDPNPSCVRIDNNSSDIVVSNCTFNGLPFEQVPKNTRSDKLKNINVTLSSNTRIFSNNIFVTGSCGIQINSSSNVTIEYNDITTETNDFNLGHQIDCVQIGGLGKNNGFTLDERTIIRNNTLINSSRFKGDSGHDDCIQFYTDIQVNEFFQVVGNKRYYYGINKYQIVEIYCNYLEQVSSNNPENNGIIIGGCGDNGALDQTVYSHGTLGELFDINYQQGKKTKWYIWSNIVRHYEGKNLVAFNNMDPEDIQIFNNTFYQASNTTNSGNLLVFYNMWNNIGDKLPGNDNYSYLRNFLLKDNIFYTGASQQYGRLLKFGHYDLNNLNNTFDDIYAFIDMSSSTVVIDYNWYYKAGLDKVVAEKYSSPIAITYQFSNGWGGYDSYGGNSDPKFVINPPAQPSHFALSKDYLYSRSPCIDKGSNLNIQQLSNETLSFEGKTRGVNGPWDIGAYETDLNESIQSNPNGAIVLNAYPLPFNPFTTIQYSIPENGTVSIKIYDILGKEVSTLINDFKFSGNYSIGFDGRDLPSGLYFCVLTLKNYTKVEKLILLK